MLLEGSGPPLLFLHGLGATPELSSMEAPSGFRLALPLQRGHGDLDWPTDPSAYGLSALVADAISVLDSLGWDRAHVGGTSMGAAVAMRLALDHPERVRNLFLAGPALSDQPNPDAGILVEMAGFLDHPDMARCVEDLLRWQRSRGVPAQMSEAVRRFSAHRPAALRAALLRVPRWTAFSGDAELDLLPPTVIVAWPDDPLHPLDLAERISGRTGAPLGKAPGLLDVVTDPGCVGRAWPTEAVTEIIKA